MRTNIEIDDKLISKVMKAGAFRTKREAVAEALRSYLLLQAQRDIIKYRGKLKWEGDLDAMRRDR
ncbi:MAG: type II toxin-antitoxin system VapB family antitoxin [Parvularculaceae bacterium]